RLDQTDGAAWPLHASQFRRRISKQFPSEICSGFAPRRANGSDFPTGWDGLTARAVAAHGAAKGDAV
ncbi:MAG: hypothetical protein J0J15_35565, partial [Mesorhizobium sp.]|nr:hypothetical protein [Mesorhizobium sp.]